jgi:carboxypeptidase C (cathepsin A)
MIRVAFSRFSLRVLPALFAGLMISATASARAEDAAKPKIDKPDAVADSTTEGKVAVVSGKSIAYTAVVGTITVGATDPQDALLGNDGKPLPGTTSEPKSPEEAAPTAKMSYVAYFAKDEKTPERPVVFFYNGGPGSSTVWLHMGSFGPKRAVAGDGEYGNPAPYKLVENQYSLLDVADLVFIDAPGTGFGRLQGKDAEKSFWGVDEDAHAFARFIPRFLSKYGRWNSPRYLFGESYGTTRSAQVALLLTTDKSTDLNGVILLSQILNFDTSVDEAGGNPGNDLPYELALPTYAATAWYHKKLANPAPALAPFLTEVENYAMSEYAHALAQGTGISAEEKQRVAAKLHDYTGLPVDYLLKADMRVAGGQFEKTLQDDAGLTTGRLDTRYSGTTVNPLSESADYDPQSSAISSAYVSLFNDYVRRDLKYGEGQTYLAEALFHGFQWEFKHNNPVGPGVIGLNVMPDMAAVLKTAPKTKLMVLGGYFDLATPYFAALYEDRHLQIPSETAKKITYHWYPSGHMVYVNEESLKKLHEDVAAFVTTK